MAQRGESGSWFLMRLHPDDHQDYTHLKARQELENLCPCPLMQLLARGLLSSFLLASWASPHDMEDGYLHPTPATPKQAIEVRMTKREVSVPLMI